MLRVVAMMVLQLYHVGRQVLLAGGHGQHRRQRRLSAFKVQQFWLITMSNSLPLVQTELLVQLARRHTAQLSTHRAAVEDSGRGRNSWPGVQHFPLAKSVQ